jgi:hypothetical protein
MTDTILAFTLGFAIWAAIYTLTRWVIYLGIRAGRRKFKKELDAQMNLYRAFHMLDNEKQEEK